jgi:MerR family transcriptional regulator, light-induced transcriptional regulator
VSPRQVAEALGVSEASLKRWCDRGLIPAVRTAGGHRRLPINEVLQFVRQQGHALVRPEVLGLPRAGGVSEQALSRIHEIMREAIEAGDEEQCRRLLFKLYLGGRAVHEICDQIIAPAFREIGTRWSHGDLEVYEERRGVEVCTRALYQLRLALPTIKPNSPVAIGATLAGDPYTLPTTMIELVLREAGWYSQSYGIGHPASTLCAAIEAVKPRMFWLSVSTLSDPQTFLQDYGMLYETAGRSGISVVVGGRALVESVRQQMRYAAYCDTLGHLVGFAASLHRACVE